VLGSCGGGDTSSDGGSADAEPRTSAPSATLGIISTNIESSKAAGDDFVAATEGQRLDIGSSVRTDATGFAEITYHDGSWQRIEAEATLTIEELTSSDTNKTVATSVDIGRTWNRVRELTDPEDSYELTTPVATASVRGTAFSTDCPTADQCTFVVTEGTVVITPITGDPVTLIAPGRITIQRDLPPGVPELVGPDVLRAEPWVSKNLELDTQKQSGTPGLESPTQPTEGAAATPEQISTATMAGTYDITRTIVESSEAIVEAVAQRVYVFETVCADAACTSNIRIQTVNKRDGASTPAPDVVIPLVFDGSSYSGPGSRPTTCSDESPSGTVTFSLNLRPTGATFSAGLWRTTTVTGSLAVNNVFTRACPGETGGPGDVSSERSDLVGTRRPA